MSLLIGACLIALTHSSHFLKNDKKLNLLQKREGFIPNCSDLKEESASLDTICLSRCGESATDPNLECNLSANSWNYELELEKPAVYATPKGERGCDLNMSRYKCVGVRNNSQECDSLKVMNPGDHCYTACGIEQCPKGFKQPSNEDFKRGDCRNGSRVRCVAVKRIKTTNQKKLPIELMFDKH